MLRRSFLTALFATLALGAGAGAAALTTDKSTRTGGCADCKCCPEGCCCCDCCPDCCADCPCCPDCCGK